MVQPGSTDTAEVLVGEDHAVADSFQQSDPTRTGKRQSLTRAVRDGFCFVGKTRYEARSTRVRPLGRCADFVPRGKILPTAEHISAHVAERSDEDSA